MKVIIAEKPSVAKDIAAVLKVNDRKQGYFQGLALQVTWAFGHLVELAPPEDYGYTKPWKTGSLPIIPPVSKLNLKKDSSVQDQFNIIKELFSKADEIIVATDAGREGELIFRYIYILCGSKVPFRRLWISSLTNEAILKGFQQLKPGQDYDNLYNAARGRSEADWLVGMNATIALTASANQGLMSVGRVQTPTLAIVTKAYLDNRNFVSETYFTLSVILSKNGHDFKATYAVLFKNKPHVLKIKENLPGDLKCTNSETIEINEGAPLLFDLSTLQQEANKKYGFKAKKTLDLMQQLYERHKVLTYPRTNSRYLSDDMQSDVLTQLTGYSTNHSNESIKRAAAHVINNPLSKKPFNNEKITDHHAIIPTNKKEKTDEMTPDELIIYNMVQIRFIQAFMPPAKKLKTKLSFTHDDGVFEAKGSQILIPGFLALEQKHEDVENREDLQDDQQLPEVQVGDILPIKEKKIEQKLTKGPALLTEASLLRKLETAGKDIEEIELKEALKYIGIGTSATRAAIIEKLFSVGYIENKGKSLIPTSKGLALYEIIKDKSIGSAELTGRWEQKLNLIAEGKYPVEEFDKEIKEFTKTIVQDLVIAGKNMVFSPGQNDLVCPKCNKGIIKESSKAWGCSAFNEGCSFIIWKEISGKKLTEKQVETFVKKGATGPFKFKSKTGKVFEATLIFDAYHKAIFDFNSPK